MKITIPVSIDEAVSKLNGLERLLTATEWEKAAIVAAFVEVSDGKGKRNASSSISPVEFAALGITGLKSKDTVRRYVEAWGDRPKPKPGQVVNLPTGEFPKVKTKADDIKQQRGAVAKSMDDDEFRQKVIDDMNPETRKRLAADIISESTPSEVEDIALDAGAVIVKPIKPGGRTDAPSQKERDQKKKQTSHRYGLLASQAVGKVEAARSMLISFIEMTRDVEFSDDDLMLFRDTWDRFEAAIPLARAAATGQSGTDWDAALAALGKEN